MPQVVVAAAAAIGVTISTAVASAIVTIGMIGVELGISALMAPGTPSTQKTPTQWKADPTAGIPMIIGRTASAGDIVYRQVGGSSNQRQWIVAVLSGAGPIDAFEQIFCDSTFYNWDPSSPHAVSLPGSDLWENHQLGNSPETAYLDVPGGLGGGGSHSGPDGKSSSQFPVPTPLEWADGKHKLNGLAASMVNVNWDVDGNHTMTTPPTVMWRVRGVKVYDPRLDSTYPGGSGPQRMADPLSDTAGYDAARATWTFSENPYLHALHWLLGRWERDPGITGSTYLKILGVGIPWAAIHVDQFVAAANIADANGWKAGGVVSSTDDKWDVYKKILEAGSGLPIRLGAQIGCIVDAPAISLDTITANDIVGDCSIQVTQARRDRINACIPRIRFEDLIWEQDSVDPIVVPSYVAFDGVQRNLEITLDLVQCPHGQPPTQAAQLARYAIENAREIGPIVLPLKLRWMGYKPGDCLTVNVPELGLSNQTVIVLSRQLDPSTGIVTLTCRSETAGKHAFALGQTSTAPPTPTISVPPAVQAPGAGSWAITDNSVSNNGTTVPALVIEGSTDQAAIDAIIFEYREFVGDAAGDRNTAFPVAQDMFFS